MSSTATAWAREQPLTGRKKHILLAIARAVDETGACRTVTQESLSASCGCTVRQVRRLVNELAAEPPTRAPRWRQSGGFLRAAARGEGTATQGSMSGLVENRGDVLVDVPTFRGIAASMGVSHESAPINLRPCQGRMSARA
jgi:hypothetical protein